MKILILLVSNAQRNKLWNMPFKTAIYHMKLDYLKRQALGLKGKDDADLDTLKL